jgi:hypothetical protein
MSSVESRGDLARAKTAAEPRNLRSVAVKGSPMIEQSQPLDERARQRLYNARHYGKQKAERAALVKALADERAARAREQAEHAAIVTALIESNAMRNARIDELHARFNRLKARADALTGDNRSPHARADAASVSGPALDASIEEFRVEYAELIEYGNRYNLWLDPATGKSGPYKADVKPDTAMGAPSPVPAPPLEEPT